MHSSQTWQLRKAVEEAEDILGPDRLVDMGIRLHVVRQDFDHGSEVIAGKAPIVSLRVHDLGGMVDTRLRKIVGPSERPQIWYCSEAQEDLVLHERDESRILAYGAMGAGKSETLSMWMVLRVLELTGYGGEIGGTAPTDKRLGMLIDALVGRMPSSWYTLKVKDHLFIMRNGVRMRLMTTAQRSGSQGSPIQGWNWSACASDEIQDSLEVDSDIEARGRAAPIDFGYRRICSATAKDTPEWRAARDAWMASGLWHKAHMVGLSNPFVPPGWWDELKKTMSEREYARKVMAQDVGAENAVYSAFDEATNLRPVPVIGARDITAQLLGGHVALLGYDPGSFRDVTEMLKCYEVKGERLWFVVDEFTTERTTAEGHAAHVRTQLRERWGYQYDGADEPKVLVRMDPYDDSESGTDRSIYTTWKLAGFKCLSAAYNKQALGKGTINLEAGVEMLQRLFCDASKRRRLFIACDEHRKPAAPKLLHALLHFERDAAGKAKGDKSHKQHDLSDWPSALMYALWPYERLRDVNVNLNRGRG